jgi:hypothetical protein
VGPRAGLDAVEKRETSCPCRESNPDSLVVQSVFRSLYRLSYPGSEESRKSPSESRSSLLYAGNWEFPSLLSRWTAMNYTAGLTGLRAEMGALGSTR